MNPIFWSLLLQLFLILLNAIFAGAEIAIISMNDTRMANLAKKGDKRALRLARLTNQPARFLATIQVAITLSGFLGSAFAADTFSDKIVQSFIRMGVTIPPSTLNTISVIIITIILAFITLVFGELVPKRIGMKKAETLALALSGLINLVSKIFSPVVGLLTLSTNAVLRLMRINPNEEGEKVTEEEIRMMIDEGSEKGTIQSEEKIMIQNVFEFNDLIADEICTHRKDIDFLRLEKDMDEWVRIIHDTRHTLYPITDENIDNIIGILNTKDYFRLENKNRENIMKHAVTEPYFVHDSIKANVLFRNMKISGNNMAVILDEYGGVSGIITMNDLIAQIVGDYDDDSSSHRDPEIQQLSDNLYRIKGSAALEEVAAILEIPLPTDDFETFSGIIFDALGYIPDDGSQIEVNAWGLSIQVQDIKEHFVQDTLVKKL